MVFFWAVFDSFVSYFTPILITEHGFSNGEMGLIYASSSVFGAIFDFVLSKVLKRTHYRRAFLLLFLICAGYPMILWGATTVLVFMVAMVLWGLYYDVFSFALFDFVSRESPKDEHASSFGTIGVFKSMGYLVGPLVAGGLAADPGSMGTSYLSQLFLFISFLFLIALVMLGRQSSSHEIKIRLPQTEEDKSVTEEMRSWYRVGRKLVPVLLFSALIFLFDAVYWTIGPLLSEEFSNFADFGGLFLVAATIPGLITVWLVGGVTSKYGKKKTAYVSFLISCIVLFWIGFLKEPLAILALVFVSAFLSSMSFPSIFGAYADYLKESHRYHNEIIGIEDFAVNIGYVIGPMMAGFLSGAVGNLMTFTYVAAGGIVVVLLLLLTTPKEIDVRDKKIG